MSLKNKALLFNFIFFTLFFLVIRYAILDFFTIASLVKAIIAAVVSSILAPKFMVTRIDQKSKLVMKWIFIKGFKSF